MVLRYNPKELRFQCRCHQITDKRIRLLHDDVTSVSISESVDLLIQSYHLFHLLPRRHSLLRMAVSEGNIPELCPVVSPPVVESMYICKSLAPKSTPVSARCEWLASHVARKSSSTVSDITPGIASSEGFFTLLNHSAVSPSAVTNEFRYAGETYMLVHRLLIGLIVQHQMVHCSCE